MNEIEECIEKIDCAIYCGDNFNDADKAKDLIDTIDSWRRQLEKNIELASIEYLLSDEWEI